MNTANANNSHAYIAFLLLLVLVSILDKSNNITAKAHGLILSANAAGSIIHKNLNLDFNSQFHSKADQDIVDEPDKIVVSLGSIVPDTSS